MLDWPFPFWTGRATMPAMFQREAGLSLREPRGIVRVRISWPIAGPDDGSPVLVCLADADTTDYCRELGAEAGLVVLSVRTAALDVATIAVEWTADHARQLGADPDRLMVAGKDGGASLAAAVALHARDQGWPPLARQVLIGPDLATAPAGESLAEVAPATVVGAGAYAARLREGGVEVEELPGLAGLAPALRRAMSLERTAGPSD
jgi:acetyl esterase